MSLVTIGPKIESQPLNDNFAYLQSLARSQNCLINGNFDVWQRGITFNNPNIIYTADRWMIESAVDAQVKVYRSNDAPRGSKYSLRIEASATGGIGAFTEISQHIEDYRIFAGQTVTFSGLVKCDSGVSMIPVIFDGKQFVSPALSDTTWTRFSLTATLDSSLSQLKVFPIFSRSGISAGKGINLAQMQLTIGDVALPFQPRSNPEELAACQWFCKLITAEGATTSYTKFAVGQCISSTKSVFVINFESMRIAPTVIFSSPGEFLVTNASATASRQVTNISIVSTSRTSAEIEVTVADGLVAGNAAILSANANKTSRILLDAEL